MEKRAKWLKKKLIEVDDHKWVIDNKDEEKDEKTESNEKKNNDKNSINIIKEEEKKEKLRYIGGIDISYVKPNGDVGISGLVVCDVEQDFKIVYEDYKLVKIKEPYIPSFLAFREVNPYVELINDLKQKKPKFVPQVILVDGNGIFHPRGFGIASHLGVLVDIPTIGCAKTVFELYNEGITIPYVQKMYRKNLFQFGDSYPLIGYSDKEYGYALRSTDYYDDPIIVSLGHKVSNETALDVAIMCCYYKEPEPIRLADLITRRLISAYKKAYNPEKWNLKNYFYQNYGYIHKNLYK